MPELPRAARVALAALVGGALLGTFLALTATPSYRARAAIVVAPALRTTGVRLETTTGTIVALVGSSTVLNNVTDALGRPRGAIAGAVHARARQGTAFVEITVDQPTAIGAERVAQEILVALPALAASRLPHVAGMPVLAADSPGGSARTLGRPYLRNAVLGGGTAALLALAGLGALAARPRRPNPRAAEAPLARPVAVGPDARPAPVPAPAPPPAAVAEPVPVRAPETEPAPAPEPEPVPAPQPAPQAPGRRRGGFAELERIAAAETDPLRREELELYLGQLRGHVIADGTLPPNFAPLVEQIFGSY